MAVLYLILIMQQKRNRDPTREWSYTALTCTRCIYWSKWFRYINSFSSHDEYASTFDFTVGFNFAILLLKQKEPFRCDSLPWLSFVHFGTYRRCRSRTIFWPYLPIGKFSMLHYGCNSDSIFKCDIVRLIAILSYWESACVDASFASSGFWIS